MPGCEGKLQSKGQSTRMGRELSKEFEVAWCRKVRPTKYIFSRALTKVRKGSVDECRNSVLGRREG